VATPILLHGKTAPTSNDLTTGSPCGHFRLIEKRAIDPGIDRQWADVRALDDDRERAPDSHVATDSMEKATLADGTRSVSVPSATKGLRITTRCVTIEEFIDTYHQICDDDAIFIPNTRRPIETVMQFRFDLQDGNPALLGMGTVVEELATKHNRFKAVGIVVALQRLSRASEITFDEMLAMRARAAVEAPAPAPVYPRAMTVPIAVMEAPKAEPPRPVIPIPVPALSSTVPAPVPVPASTSRTKTVIGLAALAKKAMETVRIPAIAPPAQKPPFAIPAIASPAVAPVAIAPVAITPTAIAPAAPPAIATPTILRPVATIAISPPTTATGAISPVSIAPASIAAPAAFATAAPAIATVTQLPTPMVAQPAVLSAVPSSIDDGWESIANRIVDIAPTRAAASSVPVVPARPAAVFAPPAPTLLAPTPLAPARPSPPARPQPTSSARATSIVADALANKVGEVEAVSAPPACATSIVEDSLANNVVEVEAVSAAPARATSTVEDALANKVGEVEPESAPARATSTVEDSLADLIVDVEPVFAPPASKPPAAAQAAQAAQPAQPARPAQLARVTPPAPLAFPVRATSIVEDSLDVSEGSLTSVDDLALASAQADQALVVPFEDHATAALASGMAMVTAVTVVERRVPQIDPDLFETVTAVESPDNFLLALMRTDGRAAPVSIQAIVPAPEPLPPAPVVTETRSATFLSMPAYVPIAAPIAIEHLAHAPVRTTRRPWRLIAAAGAFALLLCATAAATAFVHRPASVVPPSATFVPAAEAPSATVVTTREQAPPIVAPAQAPKKPALAPPVAVKSKPPVVRAPVVRPPVVAPPVVRSPVVRPPVIARPPSRPPVVAPQSRQPAVVPQSRQPAVAPPLSRPPVARPVRRPAAPRKCTDLRCL
jgi:hypothetical protein